MVLHSVVHNIQIHMYKNLLNNAHQTFSYLALHPYHTTYKIQINACNHNPLIFILQRMIHIISKYNVHNLTYIILININHTNVQINVHLIHTHHIIHFNIIVLLNVLIIYQKTKQNIVSTHLNAFNNTKFYQKINHIV